MKDTGERRREVKETEVGNTLGIFLNNNYNNDMGISG